MNAPFSSTQSGRVRGVWTFLAILGAMAAPTPGSTERDAMQSAKDLVGVVLTESGEPLNGARVEVSTARPLVGPQYLCPSCYRDCAKYAEADATGRFRLPALQSDLQFELLVLAPGYEPTYASDVGPGNDIVEIRVPRVDLSGVPPARVLRIVVENAQHAPVAGALVTISVVRIGGRMMVGGDTRMATVSDARGAASLADVDPEAQYDVTVTHHAHAPRYVRRLKTGAGENRVTLTEGATLSGTVWRQSAANAREPLPFALIGVTGPRSADGYLPPAYVHANADGRYLLLHLPPNRWMDVFVACNGAAGQNGFAAAPDVLEALGEGEHRRGYDFVLREGRTVRGRIVLPVGHSVPEGSRAIAIVEHSEDEVVVSIGADGSFELSGLPQSRAYLMIQVPGFNVADPRLVQATRGGIPMSLTQRDLEFSFPMQLEVPLP